MPPGSAVLDGERAGGTATAGGVIEGRGIKKFDFLLDSMNPEFYIIIGNGYHYL
jgi:hypothetical protein